MKVRVAPLLVVLLAASGVAWAAMAREGGADERHPVVVGSQRLAAGELHGRAAADRAIERLWLRGEAAARGIRLASARLPAMRAQVADALAGEAPGPAFAARFEAFHARWRARTACIPAYHDAYADRCGNQAAAPEGSCRWMGEASLCRVAGARRPSWLVFHAGAALRQAPRSLLRRARLARGGHSARVRRRAAAIALVEAVYRRARSARELKARRAGAARERAARRARAERDRARNAREQAARRARAASELAARHTRAARDLAARQVRAAQVLAARQARASAERRRRLAAPALSRPTLTAARGVCARFARDADPYLFGTQDPAGQAEGLLAAREAAASRLPGTARDAIDRGKLQPLLRAARAGNALLAAAARDPQAAEAALRRFDAGTVREQRLARGLGLGSCLGLRTRRAP